MTIFNWIIRLAVALVLGVSCLISLLTYLEARSWERAPDLVTFIALGIFGLFGYLLWIIK